MAELAHLITPPPSPGPHAGLVLLGVLEAAQRLVAYCENEAVGTADDAELAVLGLPTRKLERALRDLRHSVREMNQALATEEACSMLAALWPAAHARRVA
jgi:hypothetical protein